MDERIIDDQEIMTVDETAKRLRLSRSSVYEGIRRGEIPAIRVGRRILVLKGELDRLLQVQRSS